MQKYTNEGIFQKQRASGAALQGSAFIAQEVERFMAQEVKNAMMRCEVLQGYWCS